MATPIPRFRPGQRLTAEDLNRIVDAVNALLSIAGDGLIEINRTSMGFTLRLAVDRLLERLPKLAGAGAGEAWMAKIIAQDTAAETCTVRRVFWNGTEWQEDEDATPVEDVWLPGDVSLVGAFCLVQPTGDPDKPYVADWISVAAWAAPSDLSLPDCFS